MSAKAEKGVNIALRQLTMTTTTTATTTTATTATATKTARRRRSALIGVALALAAASALVDPATAMAGTTQTITFNNPGTQNFGTTPTLSATASSTLPTSFSSATTSVCTITPAGVLTFVTAGTCTIAADQAGDSTYSPAAAVSQSFTVAAVAPGPPTITGATGGDAQVSVTFTAPTSTGGAAISGYTATSNPGGLTGTCPNSPCLVTGLTNGTAYSFAVNATNSAGPGIASGASGPVVPMASQSITFMLPPSGSVGDAVDLSATASSGLAVSFALAASSTGGCAISGATLNLSRVGTCVVDATQAGDAAFRPAATLRQTLTVYAAATAASYPSLDLSDTAPSAAGMLLLTANGFLPGSTATFWLHSDPVLLGSVTVDPTGAALLTVTLPSGFVGAHQIEAAGTSASGTPIALARSITIAMVTGPELADTGLTRLGPSISLTAVLLLVGISLVGAGARRRSSTTVEVG